MYRAMEQDEVVYSGRIRAALQAEGLEAELRVISFFKNPGPEVQRGKSKSRGRLSLSYCVLS